MPEIASQPPTPGQGFTSPHPGGTQTTRQDLRAVMAARRDLGPEYEDALVDSFLDKLDVEIAARVRNEVAAQIGRQPLAEKRSKDNSTVGMAIGSLALGIPLTAIAANAADAPGLLLAWGGIVAVNLAHALSRRPRR
ncbi:hypothetical protein [Microbispora sp. H11081]|uniref:hypothetical protein n=1 Tax=Microbispora sp. H11081 TaxID=2729107 RepID=UPI0014767C0C|nr:hypothetical protein [Microbispora sp. H11081]